MAQAAIDKGRKMGAKTQRERDYLEAVAAYYEDFANRERAARSSRAPRPTRRSRRSTRTTTRRRSSTRCTSRPRRARPTRRFRRTSRPPRSSRSSSPSIPTIRACRALPDPQLRRAADRAEGATRGAALREHRAGRAARAAHAVAHLHARRRVAGIGGDQPPLGRRRVKTATSPTSAARAGLRGLRLPAARARRRRAQDVPDEARASQGLNPARAIARTRSRRCRRATRWSAAPGARRRSCSPPTKFRSPRRSRISRARSARRAAATRGRAQKDSSRSSGCAQLSAREERLLGDRGRGPAPVAAAWTRSRRGRPTRRSALMRAAADMEDKSEKNIVTPGPHPARRASCSATC